MCETRVSADGLMLCGLMQLQLQRKNGHSENRISEAFSSEDTVSMYIYIYTNIVYIRMVRMILNCFILHFLFFPVCHSV